MITRNENIINIGDWNMNFSSGGNQGIFVNHDLGSNYKKIRNISIIIRDDNDSGYYDFNGNQNSLSISISSSSFLLTQTPTSSFDIATFNATSYNRGWIKYELV